MARRISVEIVGDSRSLERAFARSERSAKSFNQTITRQNQSSAASFQAIGLNARLLGGAGALAVMKQSVDAASSLNEQMSRSNVVFGSSAAAITDWSKNLADSFGLAQTQALQAAGTFGALFANTGRTQAQAADLSKGFVQLAADLASFNDTSVDDALEALRSGLSGEIEPLRRFQVFLTEAAVQQQALTDTGKKSATQLTQGEKILARYELIMQQTTRAQGDFARTSEGAANQQRTLAANVANLETSLGKVLLPTLTDTVSMLNDGASAAKAFADQLNKIPSGGVLTRSLGGAFSAFKDFLAKNPFGIGKPYGGGPASVNPAVNPNAIGPARPSNLAALAAASTAATKKAAAGPAGVSAAQRNEWFDAMIGRQLGRVQDISTLQGQIARLKEIAALVQQRLAATKDVTRRLTLEDQILEIQRTVLGDQAQIAENTRAAAEDLTRKRKAAADALKEAAMVAAETRLGWLDFAVERAQATTAVADDLRAYRAVEAALKGRIAKEGRTLDLVRQLWETRQKIADLNKSKAGTDPLAGSAVSSRMAEGIVRPRQKIIDLYYQQVVAAERRVHVHVNIDGREVGRAVTTHQARTAHRTARQTSGLRTG